MKNFAVLVLAGTLLGSAACSSGPRIDPTVALERRERLTQAMKLTDRGDRAADRGNTIRALEYYREAVRVYPDLASSWNNLGVLLLEMSNFMDAAEAFKQATRLQPTDPRPLTNLGISYHEAGFDSDALEYFDRAIELDPRFIDAIRGATRAHMRLRSHDRRAEAVVRAGLMYETDARWRGVFEREQYRIESAQELSERD